MNDLTEKAVMHVLFGIILAIFCYAGAHLGSADQQTGYYVASIFTLIVTVLNFFGLMVVLKFE